MASLKYLLPALAVAGRAAAQCSNTATTTIQSSGDASALASCSTFSGSIAIATGTTDPIALDGIQKIDGSLIANNVTGMPGLSGDVLTTITDEFVLDSVTVLTSLNFPELTNVANIQWNAVPNLQQLSFGTEGVQEASQVNIQNTGLNTLNGINLMTVDQFYIANNGYLHDISMQLANVTTSLTLEGNGSPMDASFPNLIWANNLTFRDVSSVEIPSLQSLNGSLGFYNTEVSNITAANLTTVGESLSFDQNFQLTNVSMPTLTTIGGGFSITNNTLYDAIAFPEVQMISGALDCFGNFSSLSLPALKVLKGAFNVQSSADISSSCAVFNGEHSQNGIIRGQYVCSGEESHPSSSTSGVGSASSASATSSSGANGFYAQSASVTGLMGVIAAIFGML